MEDFLKFLADPTVQIIGWTLGVIGWIVGIVSGYLQIRSYREQKENEGGYRQLLEEAGRDRKAQFTKEQLDSMAQEMQRLEKSIKRDIPQKARRIFLEDQLATLTDDLAKSYSQYNEIVAELENEKSKLPEQIQRVIETSIIPSYLANKRETKQVYWLLIIAISLIVVLNWNSFAEVIPLDWEVGDYMLGVYPLSWLVIYIFFIIITAALLINRTSIGIRTRNLVTSVLRENSEEKSNKSAKEQLVAEIRFFWRFFLLMVGMIMSIFSPWVYMNWSQNTAINRYGEGGSYKFIAMPLSSVPLAILCAIPPSILLFLIYDLVIRNKRKISRNLKS